MSKTSIQKQPCKHLGSIGHRIFMRVMKEKTPLLQYFLCFQMHSKSLELKYLSEKLPLSPPKRYFRGSLFSQCFILKTALSIARIPSRFLCYECFFLVITNSVQCFNASILNWRTRRPRPISATSSGYQYDYDCKNNS